MVSQKAQDPRHMVLSWFIRRRFPISLWRMMVLNSELKSMYIVEFSVEFYSSFNSLRSLRTHPRILSFAKLFHVSAGLMAKPSSKCERKKVILSLLLESVLQIEQVSS